MNQDSSYLVSRGRVKVVIKASGNENGGAKDVAYTYSVAVVFFIISFQYRDCRKRNQVRTISSNAMADTNM